MGRERFHPGSTAETGGIYRDRQWVQVRGTILRYFPINTKRSWGYYAEFTASTQPLFSNYRSSLTSAPQFAPLPDSRTIFMENYRSPRYAAVGLRFSQGVFGKLEWRTEAYTHVNFQPIKRGEGQQASRSRGISFSRPLLTASSGFVYQTPVGPLALHVVHYDDSAKRWGVYAHLGYLLFHNRSLD
jgi:NTE family protein